MAIVTLIITPGAKRMEQRNLNSVGNWRRKTVQSVGESESTTEVRQHNKLHQITRFGTACTYAAAGNLTDHDSRLLAWRACHSSPPNSL